MSRYYITSVLIALLLALSAKAQSEIDSVFTWKQLPSTDLSTLAQIQFIPRADLVATNWAFGDGSSSTQPSPIGTFAYSQPTDSMSVTLTYTSNGEAKTHKRTIPLSPAFFWVRSDASLQNFAEYKRIFVSSFSLENTPTSIGTLRFVWFVDGVALDGHYFAPPALGQWPNIYHTFPTGGTHVVKLNVFDSNAPSQVATCSRTIMLADIVQGLKLENVPNVFTPNGDGVNDYFEVASSGVSWFVIRIFSRSGAALYQGEGSVIRWNGCDAQGQMLADGIYYYVIEDKTGTYLPAKGFVYLYGDAK